MSLDTFQSSELPRKRSYSDRIVEREFPIDIPSGLKLRVSPIVFPALKYPSLQFDRSRLSSPRVSIALFAYSSLKNATNPFVTRAFHGFHRAKLFLRRAGGVASSIRRRR